MTLFRVVRMARRRKYGRLVTVFYRKVRGKRGNLIARWIDPFTGGQKQVSLTKEHGIETKEQAGDWIEKQSEKLHEDRKRARKRLRGGLARKPWVEVEVDYLAHLASRLGENAATSRRRSLLAWQTWLKTQPYCRCGADLTLAGLESFHLYLANWKDQKRHKGKYANAGKPVSAATRNHYRANTVALLNWARRKGYLVVTGDDIKDSLPKFKDIRRRPRTVAAESLRAILDEAASMDSLKHFSSRKDKGAYSGEQPSSTAGHVYEPMGPLVLLLMLSGMRLGEALHLRWKSVDLRFKNVRVEADPATGWKPKTSAEREITLVNSPALLKLLRTLKKHAGRGLYVIPGHQPDIPRNFHRPSWDRLVAAAGATDITPKHLRSTWVTALAHARGGPSAHELSELAGHGVQVAANHYVARAYARPGKTVEQWLGLGRAPDRLTRAIASRLEAADSSSSATDDAEPRQ